LNNENVVYCDQEIIGIKYDGDILYVETNNNNNNKFEFDTLVIAIPFGELINLWDQQIKDNNKNAYIALNKPNKKLLINYLYNNNKQINNSRIKKKKKKQI